MKEKLKMYYLTWKQHKYERAIESVTMAAQFYHLRDEDITELEKILDEADIGGNNLPCGSVARNFDFVIKLY